MSAQTEEIKSKIDVVELVGSYLRLTKAGANFKARCPFHNEKTPSFNVSPARQMWHCFGCGKGGDIFAFIEEIEGVDFPGALKTLAERAGVELKREDPALQNERIRQFALLEEATKFFENQLGSNQQIFSRLTLKGSDASQKFADSRPSPLQYLKSRGLGDETIREFRVGYAPDEWRALFSHLTSKGFSGDEIEKSGLAVKRSALAGGSGRFSGPSAYYDRFRGRIMFPIFDYNGRVIAFGGRIFPEKDNEAKYVNSPETMLYQKGKMLYGLDKAKTAILQKGECVIVEGYMDMLMSYQAGIKNTVASSGTALTEEQIKRLDRLCGRLILAFDADSAGSEAGKRAINLLGSLAQNNIDLDVRVISLRGFKDAADAVLSDPKIWTDAVEGAQHIAQFFINTAIKKYGTGKPETAKEFEKSVLPVVAALRPLEQAYWARAVSQALNVREESVWEGLKNIKAKEQPAHPGAAQARPAVKTRKELLADKIIGIVAKYPPLLSKVRPAISVFLPKETSAAFFAELLLNNMEEAETELEVCQKELEKEILLGKRRKLTAEFAVAKQNRRDENKLLEEIQRIDTELAKFN